ncbi:putative T7SS-secreted protein [Streptomyces sp. NPDC093970]|uniref:CdiA C-terminal domain-containing protein n=1 Tax=Streptomyces sp. NPDC093970 TaxID=3155076 RepID=UPI00342D2D56
MRRPPVGEWSLLGEDGDPVPGDPDAVALLGQTLREVANDIWREAGDVEALCGVESWKSEAADAFRETARDTLAPLRKAYHRYDKAASAMGPRVVDGSTTDWASALEHAQQLADKALKAAQAAHAGHESAVRSIQGLPKGTADDDPRRTRLNKARDQAAGDLSSAKSALQHAKDVRDAAANQAARIIHRAITHDGMHDSGWDEFGNAVDSIASDMGDFLKDAGEVVVSDLASLGNAMLHDAGSTLSVLGGLALVAGGLGEEAGGVLLDATGIGAALGIPINVAAAAQIAVGVSLAGAGLAGIVNDATGPDRVDMTSDGSGGGGGDWDPAAEADRTKPSGQPDPDARPRGKPESLSKKDDSETIRAKGREVHSAETLAKQGYDVEQSPGRRPNGTKPDFRIEGQIFDNYAPTTSSPRSIWTAVETKVDKEQTERVVLNLGDSNADMGALRKQFNDWPKAGLKEVLVIDREGNIVHLYP